MNRPLTPQFNNGRPVAHLVECVPCLQAWSSPFYSDFESGMGDFAAWCPLSFSLHLLRSEWGIDISNNNNNDLFFNIKKSFDSLD